MISYPNHLKDYFIDTVDYFHPSPQKGRDGNGFI
jgi:hypothetical protein